MDNFKLSFFSKGQLESLSFDNGMQRKITIEFELTFIVYVWLTGKSFAPKFGKQISFSGRISGISINQSNLFTLGADGG